MEGWRQWRPGRKENLANENKNQRTDLTPTGLLMEGFITLYNSGPPISVTTVMAHFAPIIQNRF
jgi:hypothetical protein